MIIHSVRARNVLKYARLELTNLPTRALIAISGVNESGKTSIVETICLALFGRTFSLPEGDVFKSIRWGQTSSQVELEFSLPDGQHYLVSRNLSLDGIHGATLTKVDDRETVASGSREVGEAIAAMSGFNFDQYLDSLYLAQREISAPQSQSDTIKAVAGGVELESVAEELSDDIADEKRAIKQIEMGVDELREQINALGIWEDGIAKLQAEQQRLDAEIGENEQRIQQFRQISDDLTRGVGEFSEVGREILSATTGSSFSYWRTVVDRLSGHLGTIENACAQLDTENPLCDGDDLKSFVWEFEGRLSAFNAARERTTELRSDLAASLGESGYDAHASLSAQASLPAQQTEVAAELASARRWHFVSKLNFLAFLLLTGMSWTAWVLLVRMPGGEYSERLAEWIDVYLPYWKDDYLQWLLPAAGALSAATVFLLVRMFRHGWRVRDAGERHAVLGRRIEVAMHQAELIDYMDGMAFPQALESLVDLGDEALTERVNEFSGGPGRALLELDGLNEIHRRLSHLLEQADEQVRQVREDIAGAIGGLDNESERCRREIASAAEAISREIEKQETAADLSRQIDDYHNQIPVHEEQVNLLKMAKHLVSRTCLELYSRFNRTLREYTGQIMPKLTHGRYEHLQIDDDLTVRVFSQDKNDFADLGEVSSGTQRQIMLAVRLAMAKALTEASVQGAQFIILDEPFAFFDKHRTQSTLVALPDIDEKMCQVWIIAQAFDDDNPSDVKFDCARDKDELIYAAP